MKPRPKSKPQRPGRIPKRYPGRIDLSEPESRRSERETTTPEPRKGRTTRPRPSSPPPRLPIVPPRSEGNVPRGGAAHELHVAPLDRLANAAAEAARLTTQAVFQEGHRADRTIASYLRGRRDLVLPDQRFVAQAVFALFRWHGWITDLHLKRLEESMLLAWLLDAPTVHPACRHWCHQVRRNPEHLIPVGDAPNWTARAEGLKRFAGGRSVNADPWRLFPEWLRRVIPRTGSSKTHTLELLHALQTRPPLWVRAQGTEPRVIWSELRDAGITPWTHRRLEAAAKLPPDCDVYHLPAFERGHLEIQDIASQVVGFVCDPEPGERWWDACAGAGGKAIHLASLMRGKGVVVATDSSAFRLKEAVRRARKSPYRNITTKAWNGKHVAGKPGSFDGVLVDAPCTGIGTWRRNPDARWSCDPKGVDRLAAIQAELLGQAARGVRPGGTLVYSVCTISQPETHDVVEGFLANHAEFSLDRFPNPLDESPCDGTLTIWPQAADSDAMFVARFIRKPS